MLLVTIERAVPTAGALGPAAVSRTKAAVRRDAPTIIFPILASLPLDSDHTVGGMLNEREHLTTRIEQAARSAQPISARANPELSRVEMTFSIDLYNELAPVFAAHSRPSRMETRLGWIAGTDYTGILIYAAGELPVFGTQTAERLEPALFPAIRYLRGPDALLYTLAQAHHIDPGTLASDGPVAYTDDVQAVGLGDRIGTRPLRLLAVGVFGGNPTDIVLTERDALQIISSEHNRSLIREGRLVIVVDSAVRRTVHASSAPSITASGP